MDAKTGTDRGAGAHATRVERVSDREFVVTRLFDAPPRLVFAAWTTPALMRRWWTPASFGIAFVGCEMDVRTGGGYRFTMGHAAFEKPMDFFGRYIEVTAPSRLVWTNEEGPEGGSVTTVTFEPVGEATRVVMRDVYPSKEALDEAMVSGSTSGFEESFAQLDGVLADQGARTAPTGPPR